MVKAQVGTMPTNPASSEHQEVHIFDPYRDTIMEHCLQRRNQGQLCKNKNYPRLKTTSEPKTSKGTTWSYRIFMRYYSDMTYPLEELVREDQDFNWTDECNL